MRQLLLLLTFLTIVSCAKTEEQLVISAKKQALYHLTHNECTEARDALDEVDYQDDDAVFISLYSDTFACEAGYGQLKTAIPDMSNLSATSNDLFGTLASFNSAQGQTAADETSYSKLLVSIKEILKSGAGSAARISKFGATKAGDLHLQLLLLITVEMGKYFAYYGDADTTGVKGAGGNWNCLAQYTDATAITIIDGDAGDTCASGGSNTFAPEMDQSDTDYARRLCEGVVLFNNFLDVLSNISFSDNDSELGQLTDAGAVLNTLKTTAAAVPGLANAMTLYGNELDFDDCETTAASDNPGSDYPELQRIFAALLETNHN